MTFWANVSRRNLDYPTNTDKAAVTETIWSPRFWTNTPWWISTERHTRYRPWRESILDFQAVDYQSLACYIWKTISNDSHIIILYGNIRFPIYTSVIRETKYTLHGSNVPLHWTVHRVEPLTILNQGIRGSKSIIPIISPL